MKIILTPSDSTDCTAVYIILFPSDNTTTTTTAAA